MDRILVTGGAGFIGRNLVRKLISSGASDIIVFDNESMGDSNTVAFNGVSFVHGDVRQREQLRASMKGVGSVIHLAADTRVMDSIENPDFNFEVNVAGTFNVLLEAKSAGIGSIIYASTGGAILGEATPPIHENIPASPLAPYGASKLAGEGYLSAFSGAYGMRAKSLRFSNVYGPGSLHKGSVVAHFFKKIIAGQSLEVFGDGHQQRDFLFIDDLTDGVMQALTSSAEGVFQLGSGIPISVNQLIAEIRSVVGPEYPFEVEFKDARAGEVLRTWCNIDKAKEVFGFSASTKLNVGLEKTWSWFLEHHSKLSKDQ